jgi:glycosyltransferase involved in cell wall biosynthesis
MKILFDHQIFTLQEYGGISRYFFELIKRFDGINNTCKVSTIFSNNSYLNESTHKGVCSFFPKNEFRGKNRIIQYVNQKKSNYDISKSNFDLFHPTYYNTDFLKHLNNKPFVVTFYDMIQEKFSDKFPEFKIDKLILDQKKRILEKANRVIAISETTKKDIIDIFNISSDKIDVVYLGNSLNSTNIVVERIIEMEYILFVGNRNSYKNFQLYITTISQLLIKYNLYFICAGGGNFTNSEKSLFLSLNIESRIIYKTINNDSTLQNYYVHSLFFVFPSLYEGFGLPVLEAFASNTPILLSNGGSLPEIGGDAVEYFNSNDVNSIFNSTEKLINNFERREALKIAGKHRLQKFSWDKMYNETIEVYKKAI